MTTKRLAASIVLLALPLGCNSVLGIDDASKLEEAGAAGSSATGGAPSAGSGGTGNMSGRGGGGGSGGKGTGGSGSGGEAPTPPCNASETPSEGVFADPRIGDDTNDGSMIRPFQTLTRAASEAVAKGLDTVYLAPGPYQEALALRVATDEAPGTVSAPEGTRLTFDGGWAFDGTQWQRDCSPDAREKTVLASTSTTGVSIRGAFGPIEFRNLSITTLAEAPAALEGKAGASCYGVNASGAGLRLRFDNVEIDACPGGTGGEVTTPEAPPTLSCVKKGDECSNGAPGADAPTPGASKAGAFDNEGFVAGSGATGSEGSQGSPGTIGPGPISGACIDHEVCQEFCLLQSPNETFPHGKCGCGGFGGRGGLGGPGGGASVALFVRGPNASVDLAFATLRANDGGRGSPAAEGSAGGLGSQGAPFEGRPTCCSACDTGSCQPVGCGSLSAQGPGGQGGPGGKGGKGGGGSGGPSFAFVRVGDVEITQAQSVLSFGRPGEGTEGAPSGEAGEQSIVTPP